MGLQEKNEHRNISREVETCLHFAVGLLEVRLERYSLLLLFVASFWFLEKRQKRMGIHSCMLRFVVDDDDDVQIGKRLRLQVRAGVHASKVVVSQSQGLKNAGGGTALFCFFFPL